MPGHLQKFIIASSALRGFSNKTVMLNSPVNRHRDDKVERYNDVFKLESPNKDVLIFYSLILLVSFEGFWRRGLFNIKRRLKNVFVHTEKKKVPQEESHCPNCEIQTNTKQETLGRVLC